MKKLLAISIAAALCFAMLAVCVYAAPAEDATNLATDSTYEVHDFFHQSTVTWAYDETFPIVYNDDTGKQLTDGEHAASTAYSDAGWVGMNSTHPNFSTNGQYVLFTLAEEADVGTILVTVNNLGEAGIGAPEIFALASSDGTNWSEPVAGAYPADMEKGTAAVNEIELNKNCKYVKIDLKPGSGSAWMFLDEVEIYDDGVISEESSEAPVESSEAPAESSEAPAESSAAPVESSEAPAESSGDAESSVVPAESSVAAPAETGSDLTWLWIVLGVAAAAIVVVVIIIANKKKN